MGVLSENGRVLSKAKGSGFVASVWLENDGDPRFQDTAAIEWSHNKMRFGGGQIYVAAGKRGLRAL